MSLKNPTPKEISTSAIIIGNILCDELKASEINSLGNWFTLLGQYLETVASIQTTNENNLQNININTNSKKYHDTKNPFQEYDNSNQILREEIEIIKKKLF